MTGNCWHYISNDKLTFEGFFLAEFFSHRDIHCAGQGQDKNGVKRCYQVFLVGEGGGEEAAEGDAAEVGSEDGEQADRCLHP